MGKNIATKVMVVEITAKNISLDPTMDASSGSIPSSTFWKIFSVTTMASSTTNPTDKTTANIDNTLMENPARYITKNMPISEIGITNAGISVTRQFRKKKNMMATTRIKAITTVDSTSRIEALMNLVLSNATSMVTSSGRSLRI